MNSTRARWVLGAASVLCVLVAWQVLTATGVLPTTTVPRADAVLKAGARYVGDPTFLTALRQTMTTWVVGLLIVVALAVPLGLLVGSNDLADAATSLLIEFLKPIPPVALIPLALLLWGPSQTMKVTLVVFGALWPLFTQVVYGVRGIDNVTLEMARIYRLPVRDRIVQIYLKALLPSLATGIRIAASIALIVSIVTELVGGAPGLGNLIAQQQSAGNLDLMYALIIISGLLGLLINWLFRLVEAPLLHWHPSQRSGETL